MNLRLQIAGASLAAAGALALAGCGGDDEADVTAFCDGQAELQEASASLSTSLQGDPQAAKEALEDAGEQIQDLADSAPEEIQGDVEAISDVFNDLTEQISDADSPEDVAPLLEDLQADMAELEEAGQNIDAFIAENCDEG